MLLPPRVSDWVPPGHVAWFVIGVVERLDLSGICGAYRVDGVGRPAYDPAMMVALVLYSYAQGCTSARGIARRCVEDVPSRMIAANQTPDHSTLSRFRDAHAETLSELFFQVLALCRDAGMLRVGMVAVDSTKLAADASLSANMSYEQLRELARSVVAEAGEVDAAEDAAYGEARGDELPEELADPARRPARIEEMLERLAEREAELAAERDRRRAPALAADPDGDGAGGPARRPGRAPMPGLTARERDRLVKTKFNATDPGSGIVRHRGMLMQGYNVQTAVDEGQVILAVRATATSPDHGQLEPMVAQAKANLDRVGVSDPVGVVVADSGYWTNHQIQGLTKQGLRVLVPPIDRHARDPDREAVEVQQMRAALARPAGHQAYRRRQQMIEPVFAHIKHIRQITRIRRRGRRAAQAEIDLIATTHNLLKLFRHAPTTA